MKTKYFLFSSALFVVGILIAPPLWAVKFSTSENKASPQALEAKKLNDECMAQVTSACVYEMLIRVTMLEALRGTAMVTPVHEYARQERVEAVVRDLIGIGEFEVAEHMATREIAQQRLMGPIQKDAEIYKFYKLAKAKDGGAAKPKERKSVFYRSHGDQRYRKYMNDNFYEAIAEGNLQKAYDFIDALKMIPYGPDSERLFRIDGLGVLSSSEYIDALEELSLTYARNGDLEKARYLAGKLDDQRMVNDLAGWDQARDTLIGTQSVQLEAVEALIGAGAGTDPGVAYIISLTQLSKELLEKGDKKGAQVNLEKAEKTALKLNNPSLSLSKAALVLAAAQAYVGNNDKAFEHAEQVHDICCKPQVPAPKKPKMMMRDKQHYDWGLSGIVTGALFNDDFDTAQKAAKKMNLPLEQAIVWHEIAEAYAKKGDKKNAVRFLKAAEELSAAFAYPEEKAQILQLVSRGYFALGDSGNAENALRKGLEIYVKDYKKHAWDRDTQRQTRFQPGADILYNYAAQGLTGKFDQTMEKLNGINRDKSVFLLRAAVIAAEKGNVPAADFFLGQVEGEKQARAVRINEGLDEAIKKGKIKAEDKERLLKQDMDQKWVNESGKEFETLMDMAFSFEKHEGMDAQVKRFYERLESDEMEPVRKRFAKMPLVQAKLMILGLKVGGQKQAEREKLDHILLLIRGHRQDDGYSFVAKYGLLLEIGRLFHQFGFEPEADEFLDYAQLMADKTSSRMTRFTTPMNGKQINAAYAELAEEYMKQGKADKAEKVLGAMASRSDRVKIQGMERTIYLRKEQWAAKLAVEVAKKNEAAQAAEIAEKIMHPFYKQVAIQSILAYAKDVPNKEKWQAKVDDTLSLAQVVDHAWDDGELLNVVSSLVTLADAQRVLGKNETMTRSIAQVNAIIDAIWIASTQTQAYMLISDFYSDAGMNAEAVEYLDKASKSAKHSQVMNAELQASIAERVLLLNPTEAAIAEPKQQAREMMGFFANSLERGGVENDKIEKLTPLAKVIGGVDGGFDEAGRKRIIEYIDTEMLGPYFGDGMTYSRDRQAVPYKYEDGLVVVKEIEEAR
jgi:tetratricopeptide (TPR) repeat protein